MKRLSFPTSLGSGRFASQLNRFKVNRRLIPVFIGVTLSAIFAIASHFSTASFAQAAPSQVAVGPMWHQASFPVENFQAYTSPFGYRQDPYGGGSRFHYGLDMAAPIGSYIRSWWGGEVIEVSDDSSCGTSVVVQSGNWMHIYCHMQGYVTQEGGQRFMIDSEGGLRIREGQTVETGTRIGRIGMTGRTTGPHLHWGLKYSNDWVDPALVLRAMYDSQRAAMVPE